MEIREQLKQLIIEHYQSVVPDYQIDESKLKYDVLGDRIIMQYDYFVADYVKGEDEIGLFNLQSEWPCTVKKKKLVQSESWSPEIEPETNPIDEVQFLMDNENMTRDEAVVNLPEYKSIASGYIDFLIQQKESGII